MSFLSTDYKQRLDDHLIFKSLTNLNQLRAFMELHAYAVWDFMSLLKSLQAIISPHGSPWLPNRNTQIVRLINEIVLEEESDLAVRMLTTSMRVTSRCISRQWAK